MKKRIKARDLHLIIKFAEYRRKGLTYEEIRHFIPKGDRQFTRWTNYIKRGILTYPQF